MRLLLVLYSLGFLLLELAEELLHHEWCESFADVVTQRRLHTDHQGVNEVLVLKDLHTGDDFVG